MFQYFLLLFLVYIHLFDVHIVFDDYKKFTQNVSSSCLYIYSNPLLWGVIFRLRFEGNTQK